MNLGGRQSVGGRGVQCGLEEEELRLGAKRGEEQVREKAALKGSARG